MKPTDKLEQLYTGDEKKILHEQTMVEMIGPPFEEEDEEEGYVEEPLPPGEPAGAPEKNPITGEDMEEEEEEPWDLQEGEILDEAGVVGNVAAMLMLNPIVWAQWRTLFAIFSKAHRQCGIFRVSKDRDACLKKARMKFSMDKIKVLRKAKAGCKNSKNPQKCAKVLDSGIARETSKVQKYKVQLMKLTIKGRVGPGSEPEKTTKLL